ncbi:MAG: hypothetical protein Q8O67_10980 [Deltaproteobacteria bacterium]|nr:hypothetical protein [Deltaproteobacteria bacterium]
MLSALMACSTIACEQPEPGYCGVPPRTIDPARHPAFQKTSAPDGNLWWLPGVPPFRLLEPDMPLDTVVAAPAVTAVRVPVGLASGRYNAVAGDGQSFELQVVPSEEGLKPLSSQELTLVGQPRAVVNYCGERPMFMWLHALESDPVLALIDVWGEGQDPSNEAEPPLVDSAPLNGFDVAGDLIFISDEDRSTLSIRLRSIQDGRAGEPTVSE